MKNEEVLEETTVTEEVTEEVIEDTTVVDTEEVTEDTTVVDAEEVTEEVTEDTTVVDTEEVTEDTTVVDTEEVTEDTTNVDVEEVNEDTTDVDVEEVTEDTTTEKSAEQQILDSELIDVDAVVIEPTVNDDAKHVEPIPNKKKKSSVKIIIAIIILIILIIGGVVGFNYYKAYQKENRKIELISYDDTLFEVSSSGIDGNGEIYISYEGKDNDLIIASEKKTGISDTQKDKLKKVTKNLTAYYKILDDKDKVIFEDKLGRIKEESWLLDLEVNDGNKIVVYLKPSSALKDTQFFMNDPKDFKKAIVGEFEAEYFVPEASDVTKESYKSIFLISPGYTDYADCYRIDPNLDYMDTTGYANLSLMKVALKSTGSSWGISYGISSNFLISTYGGISSDYSYMMSEEAKTMFASLKSAGYYTIDEVKNDINKITKDNGFTCTVY